ncbi:MAG TPA: GNAT family N-acetyltransferase [Anaerolineae bacterium]|nr:GNAT family N-acetyltransferase [Caldilineae bacterium]HID33222.1 GNAT family N-acetyltransferase [Anaerolineae bacterium]
MLNQRILTFQTRDGQKVIVRRMLPADVNHLARIYRHLSPESLYLRFQEPATNLPPLRVLEEARKLAESGYTQGKGFLAFVETPGRGYEPIAGARYLRIGPDAAEVSITVRDDFQRKGVGKQLLALTLREARKAGIRKLVANVSAQNRAILQLLNQFPLPIQRERFGPELYIEADISNLEFIEPTITFETATAPAPRRRSPPTRSAGSG